MTDRHWNDEALIDYMYGVAADSGHVEGCERCRARVDELNFARKASSAGDDDVPAAFLYDQRMRIAARVGRSGWAFRLAPALGIAATVLLAALLSTPAPEQRRPAAASDAQLYSEIYSLVENTEPRAVAPIHALFQE
jgi:hypothetical protein